MRSTKFSQELALTAPELRYGGMKRESTDPWDSRGARTESSSESHPSAVPTILTKWLGGSMNYSYVLLREQDSAISNNASLRYLAGRHS